MGRISNYEELKLEKIRLQNNLTLQKVELRRELLVIKERIEPFFYVLSLLRIFKKKDDSLLTMGVKTGVELIAHNTILSKAGWLAKFIVPFVLKGISSNVIDKIRNRNHSKV